MVLHAGPASAFVAEQMKPSDWQGLCLDVDTGTLGNANTNVQLYLCRNTTDDDLSAFQTWTQQDIPGQPYYVFRLYNPGSGKCLTYYAQQYQYLGPVWAASCGRQGQGWTAYKGGFRAAENLDGYLAPIFTVQPVNGTGINLQRDVITQNNTTTANPKINWHVRQ